MSVALRRRPNARRLTLRVSGPTGQAVLTLPPRTSLASAEAFLQAHTGWIVARLGRLPERIPFGNGSVLPLRGMPHRVVWAAGPRRPPETSLDGAGEPVILISGDASTVPGRIRRFLLREAEGDLRAAVARHTAALGLAAGRIALRDTRSRWGSCSASGTLSFSWRLILAPPFVLDYLAAHEVAHLRELNHSQRFWHVLHDLCPATDEAEAWLKRHGGELHRYG